MSDQFYKKNNIIDGVSTTITTQGDAGVVLGIIDSQGRNEKKVSLLDTAPTLRAQTHGNPPEVVERLEVDSTDHKPTYVQFENGTTAYAIWLEKYKRYVAIRKLTPKECFRLQGWTDDYFKKAQFVNSDSQLYKQAGNGVTVNVIEAIGRRLTNDNRNQDEESLLPDHTPTGRSKGRVGEDGKGDDERDV